MNVPRYAAAAAKLLARHVTNDAPPAGERERGIETIERAMQQRLRRRSWWRGAAVLAAAAAFALLWIVVPRASSEGAPVAGARVDVSPLGRGATLRDSAGAHRLDSGAELGPDQAIETVEGGGASLRLSTGTRIELAGKTSFRVGSRGQSERFTLARGELSAHVAKLGPGQRFIVETPDAEIEVRGTVFQLAVSSEREGCGAGSLTRLSVTEGVVEVRSAGASVRVGRGEHWPPDCPTNAAEAPSAAAPRGSDVHRHAGPVPSVRVTAATRGAPHTAGPVNAAAPVRDDAALKRQNDLYAEAVAAAKRGDRAAALKAYEELIHGFPGSPLVENALVERMRLVLPSDPERARAEARRYLVQYPHGFAVEEAQRVVGRP